MPVSRKPAYSRSIYLTTVQIADWFNDIPITRHDEDGNITGTNLVRSVVSKKEKVCYDLEHGNPPIYANKLPFIVVEHTPGQLTYDKNREHGYLLNRYHYYQDKSVEQLPPQPVKLNYKITVFTQLCEDMEQLVEHIAFWFRPYIKVKANVPGLEPDKSDYESSYDITAVWDGDTSAEEIGSKTENTYYSTTFNISAESWNWRFTEEQSKIILKVYNSFRTWNDLQNEVDNETVSLVTFGATANDPVEQSLSIGNVMVTGAPITGADGMILPPLNAQYYADNLGNITFGDITTSGGSVSDLDTIYFEDI